MTASFFPKYFLVDHEIYVKVFYDNGVMIGENDLGNPYKPYKAMVDGREVTKEEFDKGAALRKKQYPPRFLNAA